MNVGAGKGRKLFLAANNTALALMALLCLIPLWHVLAVSFSSSAAASAGRVFLWPVDFTWAAYQYVLKQEEFLASIVVTLKRVLLGTSISMLLTVLTAYPLSREKTMFRWRTAYVWFFVFTMLFNGGLIPNYVVVKELGLLDRLLALVLPSAVQVFHIILMLNFLRNLPKELYEAAHIDGAGHWATLWRVALPVSTPSIATLTLFTIVFHWNSWFDGIIYMNNPAHYPLSSYLQTVIIAKDLSAMNTSSILEYANLSDRTVKSAQIFIGLVPIVLVYPFLQRYFIQGIVMGSVKG